MAFGLSRYFTGRPCVHGHTVERRTRDKRCLDCKREWRRAWKAANPDKYAAACRRQYAANPGLFHIRSKKWVTANRDRDAAARRAWRIANSDKVNAATARYRTRKHGNGGSHTAQDVADILSAQGGKCVYCCIAITPKNKSVDHIVPVKRGGSNDPYNLQVLCGSCNSRKHAKDPIAFLLEVQP
jgi:5-methylcytosine-specific restriction endonuclease McrA